MNAHERRPLSAETAEQLLDGYPVAALHARQLADRLAMVSTAAFPGELSGEDAAVAAFREAMSGDLVTQPGRRRMKSAVVAKLLTLKAAAIAVAAVSAGGVALAANTGALPNPLAPENPGHSTNAPDHTNNTKTNDPGTPSPSLAGLCNAYLAGAGAEHGKALENPAFTALITAAGDKSNVDAYCADLGVTAPGSGRGEASQTDHPSGPPATHPGSTDHPTGEPSHPTGPPNSD